jgi:glycosyltransferase involved in cell wall biosynthesis
MKILFVSMPSVHVTKWLENLKHSNHELYWFDILDRGKLETFEQVSQITNWRKRKIKPLKGEYFLYKKFPRIHQYLLPLLEISASEKLQQLILEIQPDIVHSFEMQSCSFPILKAMNKFPELKWIYSCWGSDLFYYQNINYQKKRIKKVLKRVDILHTDCLRDYDLAISLGFNGKHSGVIPGGGGYDLDYLEQFKIPLSERKIILVKGYEHHFGRAIMVCKALQNILPEIKKFEIHFFGCHQKVINYIQDNNLPFQYYGRNDLKSLGVLKLMGKSKIYIGNNISDGMANTLLEAIVMGAFPIQSNPGNVSAEIIENGINGLLIENPEDVFEIERYIKKVILNEILIKQAFSKNTIIAGQRLDYLVNQKKIVNLYNI